MSCHSADDYLAFCAERSEPPVLPYSGTISLWVDPELHRRAAVHDQAAGVSGSPGDWSRCCWRRDVRCEGMIIARPNPRCGWVCRLGYATPERLTAVTVHDSPGGRHHGLGPARRRASQRQAPLRPAAPARLAPLAEQLAPHPGLAVERADVRTRRRPLQRRHPDRTVEPCPRPSSPPRRGLSPIPCLTRGVLFIPASHLILFYSLDQFQFRWLGSVQRRQSSDREGFASADIAASLPVHRPVRHRRAVHYLFRQPGRRVPCRACSRLPANIHPPRPPRTSSRAKRPSPLSVRKRPLLPAITPPPFYVIVVTESISSSAQTALVGRGSAEIEHRIKPGALVAACQSIVLSSSRPYGRSGGWRVQMTITQE